MDNTYLLLDLLAAVMILIFGFVGWRKTLLPTLITLIGLAAALAGGFIVSGLLAEMIAPTGASVLHTRIVILTGGPWTSAGGIFSPIVNALAFQPARTLIYFVITFAMVVLAALLCHAVKPYKYIPLILNRILGALFGLVMGTMFVLNFLWIFEDAYFSGGALSGTLLLRALQWFLHAYIPVP